MFYHIVKIGRPYMGIGYDGPTCDEAGIQPGLTYKDFNSALKDALILSTVNLAGFNVVQTKPGQDDNGLEKFVVYATAKNGEVVFLKSTN